MDKGKGKTDEIEEWMNEFLPEFAGDIGMGRSGGVTLQSSALSNSIQQSKAMNLGENYQAAAITSTNMNPGMWQNPQCTPVGQSMASSLPSVFEEFSRNQTSSNMVSTLRQQQQLLQNQVLERAAERSNIYQLPAQSNPYPSNLRQHQPTQMSHLTSLMGKHQDSFNILQEKMIFQKSLEAQSGLVPERVHPKVQMPAFNQSQNLAFNQLKPGNQPQAILLRPSQASTPRDEITNTINWIDEYFQKLLRLKEMYLHELIMLLNRTREIRQRATDVTTVNRCEKTLASAEKILKILNLSKSDILLMKKDRAYQIMNNVVLFLREIRESNSVHLKKTQQVGASVSHLEAPQMQQRENYLQFNNTSTNLHQSLRQGGALSSLTGVHNVNPSTIVNSHQFSPMKSTPMQQWIPQGSVVPSPHKGSQICFDQRGLTMLPNPMDGIGQYSNLGTLQTIVTSPANIFNSSDYAISPIAQPSVSVSPNKRQKMKQPVQQRTEKIKQQMLQKRGEDTKLRRLVGFNQKGSPLPPPSSSSPHTSSPQNSQQSSQQLEMKDLSSKLSKSATPSLSRSSSALPSPLTPLTPSSMPADYAKSPSAALTQLPLQETNQVQLVKDSCLHKESTCPPSDKQSSYDNGNAVKRLIEVVKSMSSKALNAALQDMAAATGLTDRKAVHRLPKKFVFHDLADDISNDNENFSDNNSMESRMKRQLDVVAMDDSSTEMESHAPDRIKRLKKEPNDHLLQEIKEINQKLIEIAVDVSETESDEGTLIRCSYIPVGFSGEIKTPNTSEQMFPNLLLDLIVAPDYPNSSPTVLETMPLGCSDGEEGRYLWMKAKTKFSLSLRKFSQPIKLKEMAETWHVCTREVFVEFAEQMGGGDFSSKYGKWENCVVAV